MRISFRKFLANYPQSMILDSQSRTHSLESSNQAHGIVGAGRRRRVVLRECEHVRREARVERADMTPLLGADGLAGDSAIVAARRRYFRHTYVLQQQLIRGRLQPRLHHLQRARHYGPGCTGHAATHTRTQMHISFMRAETRAATFERS